MSGPDTREKHQLMVEKNTAETLQSLQTVQANLCADIQKQKDCIQTGGKKHERTF